MWAIGILALLAAILGFIAGSPNRISCCLSPYLTLTGLVMVGQAGLMMYLFIAPNKAVHSLTATWEANHPEKPAPDKIKNGVYVGRWVLLGLLGIQLIAVMVALILRCCARRIDQWEPFEEDASYQSRTDSTNAKLEKLKAEVAASGEMPALKKKGIALTEIPRAGSGEKIKTYKPTASFNGANTGTAQQAKQAAKVAAEGDLEAGTMRPFKNFPPTTKRSGSLLADPAHPSARSSSSAASPSVTASTGPPTRPAFEPSWVKKATK